VTAASFLELPDQFKDNSTVNSYDYLLTAANMVFFRHSNPVLSDPAVRKALVQSADVQKIIGDLGFPTHAVKGPFLLGMIGYDPALVQPPFDKAAAGAALDAAGWVKGANGLRAKGGVPLSFMLQAQDTPENRLVTMHLQDDWDALGVKADMQLRSAEDLQRTISNQNYDALLYGISIGADSDVFVYWHSSQKDPRSNRLNFSEFAVRAADTALEGGRTRADPALRQVKYRPFLQAWQQDTPALGLYQPRYLYVTHGPVFGLAPRAINGESDRYNTVNEWQIRQASIPETINR
jgi:peptide/nickel transport system substrate-binding protein